ncbi:F-box/kelch-repeat protein At3g23880 [Lycium barbarum]|uniref:F-box/kelch-repeat protein At3g23880 n=1 Tax=Lycium barbarum TaxID=112863 RepID=UPI00293F37B4|nr:F-box/kelch-repeat protein At3g23880 [Lycium barbarum]
MALDQARGIHFQEEIIMEILNRLSVRSLQRFKCVSPFWKALISDHFFKMKHLNRAKNDLNSPKLLAAQHPAKSNFAVKFSCFSLSSVQGVEDEQTLDCPSNCKPACTICCCCDGLVLLSTCDRLDRHLLLWNPPQENQ